MQNHKRLGAKNAPVKQQKYIAKYSEGANSNPTEDKDSLGSQFLLTEFNELAEDWRHADNRIETAINFYLTTGAVVVPGAIVLYQTLQNTQLFVGALLPIVLILFLLGFFVTKRITSADIIKSQRRAAAKMIRRYFVDHDSTIAPYLYKPIGYVVETPEDKRRLHLPVQRRKIVLVINILNSGLLGFSISSGIWLFFATQIALANIIFIGVGTILVTFVALSWRYYRRTKAA